jgi:hypothetical protein
MGHPFFLASACRHIDSWSASGSSSLKEKKAPHTVEIEKNLEDEIQGITLPMISLI